MFAQEIILQRVVIYYLTIYGNTIQQTMFGLKKHLYLQQEDMPLLVFHLITKGIF